MKRYIFFFVFTCVSLTMSAQKITLGSYTFKGGGIYQGEMQSGKPYGKGKTLWKDGDMYEGDYVKGKRQGFGTYTFADAMNAMKAVGFKTTNTDRVPTIIPTTTNIRVCGIVTIVRGTA